jgi:hypothetical protein
MAAIVVKQDPIFFLCFRPGGGRRADICRLAVLVVQMLFKFSELKMQVPNFQILGK